MHYSEWGNIRGRILTLRSTTGVCVSPLLFIIYIDDLDKWLETEHLLLYADDTVVYAASKSPEELDTTLNKTLLKLSE